MSDIQTGCLLARTLNILTIGCLRSWPHKTRVPQILRGKMLTFLRNAYQFFLRMVEKVFKICLLLCGGPIITLDCVKFDS